MLALCLALDDVSGWYFGAPEVPFVNKPASSATDAHGLVRLDAWAQAQINDFFATGNISNHCPGWCNRTAVPSLAP